MKPWINFFLHIPSGTSLGQCFEMITMILGLLQLYVVINMMYVSTSVCLVVVASSSLGIILRHLPKHHM